MDIEKQYEDIGKGFIAGQEKYFSKKIDQARVFIKKQLPNLNGKIVLDIGCGHGRDILTYEELGAKEVYGLDSSEFMIREAKKIVKNPKNLVVASMDKIPFKDKTFDILIGRFSLHYLKDLSKVYEEFNRVLKDKGLIIFVVHHPILGFMQTGAKDYFSNSLIEMELYNKAAKINFPYHNISEYFSETFFKYFFLDYLEEEKIKDAEQKNQWNVPGFIGFKAIKRD